MAMGVNSGPSGGFIEKPSYGGKPEKKANPTPKIGVVTTHKNLQIRPPKKP